MIRVAPLLSKLRSGTGGTMAIETAIVAPILLMLSLGAFDASRMVARQSELQSAAAEATSIVLAKTPETAAELTTIEQVIEASTGLAANKVTLTKVYRCGTDASYITDPATCANAKLLSTFIRLNLSDTYTPRWTSLGIGSTVNYNVQRTVQLS